MPRQARLLLLLPLLAPAGVGATVTSTSTFERCVNDETECDTKLTMQINLQSGANAGEEVLISQVGCADGLCAGSEGTLNNTVKLTFYHTRPVLKYDLYYFADFNAAPSEAVVYGGKGPDNGQCAGPESLSLQDPPTVDNDQCFGKWLGPTCRDGGRDPDASCGWLYPQAYLADLQARGSLASLDRLTQDVPWQSAPLDTRLDRIANVVPDSQGFCCDCDANHFMFENYDLSRGNIQCNALDDGPHASAHCLRMDKLWYSAYDIGQSRENYNIFINIQTCDESGNHCVRPEGMRIASVGPERPRTVLRNDGNDIRIEWAPFGSADNAIDLTSKMLLRPNCHGNEECEESYAELSSYDGAIPGGTDINEPSRWLLIDRSDISMTGNDCNQIGLSYSGFRNQGEMKCVRPYDSCLGKIEVNGRLMSSSRVTDYFNEDMKSVSQNQVGRFFPQFLYPASTLAVEKNGDDYAELKYEVDEYRVSQITLIMSGELVSVREYTGILEVIDFGLSCMSDNFQPVSCFHSTTGSVESASNDGLLAVTMRNVGEHPDLYTVSFPSNKFEYDNGDGTYTNMAEVGNADLSPIQAKSTDQLPGRGARTQRCEAGATFRQSVSDEATLCWEQADALRAGRRQMQQTYDPLAGGDSASFDEKVQCGGGPHPSGRLFPDLRDDCDTVAFQVHSNNGLNRMYCVHVEITNAIGALVFPHPGTEEAMAEEGRICFNTTEINYLLVGDAEDAFAAGGDPLRVNPNSLSCSSVCPSSVDVLCMVGQPACSDGVFFFLAVIIALILGIMIFRKLGIGPCGKSSGKAKVVHVHHGSRGAKRQDAPSHETRNPLPQDSQEDLEMRYGKE